MSKRFEIQTLFNQMSMTALPQGGSVSGDAWSLNVERISTCVSSHRPCIDSGDLNLAESNFFWKSCRRSWSSGTSAIIATRTSAKFLQFAIFETIVMFF